MSFQEEDLVLQGGEREGGEYVGDVTWHNMFVVSRCTERGFINLPVISVKDVNETLRSPVPAITNSPGLLSVEASHGIISVKTPVWKIS